MEPLFQSLLVQLAPQPRQMPPPPLDAEDLQHIYSDVIRSHPYQIFSFTPDKRGAIFQNGPDDIVEVRPAQLQVRVKLDDPEALVADTAKRKVMTILKAVCTRLQMEIFLQAAVEIIALAAVPGPNPDAKAFVSQTLMGDSEQAHVLGQGYFGGGIRFRSLRDDGEDSINIEPFVHDNAMLYLEHKKTRAAVTRPLSLDQVSGWIEEGFEFLSGSTMKLLEP
jgi:hypothetical protein